MSQAQYTPPEYKNLKDEWLARGARLFDRSTEQYIGAIMDQTQIADPWNWELGGPA